GNLTTTNQFIINYDDLANGGHVITLTAVPEPGTASLLGLAGVAFFMRWRIHRKKGRWNG
ncbi:MAG: PEP-CTERM sorting domain-containing protein, partial [Verrucomicrobia bacterium]